MKKSTRSPSMVAQPRAKLFRPMTLSTCVASAMLLAGCQPEANITPTQSITTTKNLADMTSVTRSPSFLVGTGQYDVTGAVVETGSFGYVSNKDMKGLHSRLYAHAYVIADTADKNRVAYISVDAGAVFPTIKQAVLNKLQQKYGNRYTDANVMLTATHTHSGNSGFSQDLLYQIAGNDGQSYGWDAKNFTIMVDGIVNAIEQADSRVAPANISLATSDLLNATRNRSANAYNTDKDAVNYATNVDTSVNQLNFTAQDGKPLGLINWFATHPTEFSINFLHLSGDNRGYSQYFWEKKMGSSPTNPSFVASFPTSNAGDVVSSQGNTYSATGWGGTNNEYDNVEIDGKKQFDNSVQLWQNGGTPLAGTVDYRQRWIELGPNYVVSPEFTGNVAQSLCVPARGWSFASGGENGPSNIPGIYEGMTNTQNFDKTDASGVLTRLGLGAFSGLLGGGADACQGAKPVLLPDGKLGWAPTKIPVQLFRIGQVAIIGYPGEGTTMVGRRLRDSVLRELRDTGVTNVIFASNTNAYIGYTATPEEFDAQNYEGASTEFGRYQFPAFTQEFVGLARAMKNNQPVTSMTTAPVLQPLDYKPSRPGVAFDDKPINEQFGQVLVQPATNYSAGTTAVAVFRSGHPKNNYRTMGTFLKVQRLENGLWVDYLDDHDWDTTYSWQREGVAYSRATVEWRIRKGTPAGTYRLVQTGDWKNGWNGAITSYTGYSNAFEVAGS